MKRGRTELRGRFNSRRAAWAWAFAALGLSSAACGDDVHCTAEQRTAVYGVVYSADGEAVIADRVILSNKNTDWECMIQLATPSSEEPSYACWDPGGTSATLQVYVGRQIVIRDLKLKNDGCHSKPLTVDIQLAPEADE